MNTSMLNIIFYILIIVIPLMAQLGINTTYNKYKKVKNSKGLSGFEVAKKILEAYGLGDIYVVETSGNLTDHYDPTRKVIKLSKDIFHGETLAASSVAAHECGHAIQDKNGYFFLRFRSSIVPFVNFSSIAGYIAIMIGLFTGALGLFWLGIIFELVILFFELVTLPVEFNASKRGLQQLQELKLLEKEEVSKSRGMLFAAALTYVASVATTLLEILRLILMARRED